MASNKLSVSVSPALFPFFNSRKITSDSPMEFINLLLGTSSVDTKENPYILILCLLNILIAEFVVIPNFLKKLQHI